MENTGNSKCDEGVKQAWQLHIAGGTQNGTATVERSVAVSEEANTHWPYSSGILLFGICSWEIKHNVYTETSISMFMAAAFINSKYGKQQISMNWWIDKQHFIHPYSVIIIFSD